VSRQGDLQSSAETQDAAALPPGGALARYLDNVAPKEPSPIDVNIESARPLANALVKVGGDASLADEELALFKRLDTRLIVPLATHDRVIGFISLGEKLSEEPYTSEDKQLLDTLAEQTALALNYSKLVRDVAEQEKLRREVEIAKEVQARLFPQRLPPVDTLDYTGRCRAARGVGGDYYDFIPLGEGRIGLALGDVSGKGISAALLMAGLQATLRSCALAHGDGIDRLMAEVNRRMVESSAAGKYATFFYGVYDDRRGTLTYVNAGHNPPAVFRSSGELLTNGDSGAVLSETPERLETGGIVVGMFEDVVYDVETIQLRQGDILLFFTDGVTEAVDAQEREFGEDRLFTVIRQNRRLFPNDLCDVVFRSVDSFVGSAAQHDDMTIVAARVR
jgi:sigma-B regulation protein RsbU (phosphoserine phosphatase)